MPCPLSFSTGDSSVEEGSAVVASVSIEHSSNTNSMGNSSNDTVTDNTVGNSSMGNSSNEAMANNTMADTMGNRSNNTVADNPGGDKSRSDPVGADAVCGARVVGNSSDRGSESLRLGDAPVLPLQGLDHRLVGGLAACHHGVTNASHKTVTSHKAAMSPNESTRSRDKTVASNQASVSSNETKVGNRGCSGGSHKSNNRCKGLEIKN